MPKKKKTHREYNPAKGWRVYPEIYERFERACTDSKEIIPHARQLDCVHAAMLAFSAMNEKDRKVWLDKALTMNLD